MEEDNTLFTFEEKKAAGLWPRIGLFGRGFLIGLSIGMVVLAWVNC